MQKSEQPSLRPDHTRPSLRLHRAKDVVTCVSMCHTRMAKTSHILQCEQSHVFVSVSIVVLHDMRRDMITAASSPNHAPTQQRRAVPIKGEHITGVISGFVIQRTGTVIISHLISGACCRCCHSDRGILDACKRS